MKRTITGQCRFCRCTEQKPCTLPSGEDCWWFDKDRTVCTKQQHMPKIVQGIEDFEACFDNWWLCRCEQPDGARMPLVVTDSPRPDLTMAGLEKYRKRMERLMTKYFGGLVEIQVVPQKAVS